MDEKWEVTESLNPDRCTDHCVVADSREVFPDEMRQGTVMSVRTSHVSERSIACVIGTCRTSGCGGKLLRSPVNRKWFGLWPLHRGGEGYLHTHLLNPIT